MNNEQESHLPRIIANGSRDTEGLTVTVLFLALSVAPPSLSPTQSSNKQSLFSHHPTLSFCLYAMVLLVYFILFTALCYVSPLSPYSLYEASTRIHHLPLDITVCRYMTLLSPRLENTTRSLTLINHLPLDDSYSPPSSSPPPSSPFFYHSRALRNARLDVLVYPEIGIDPVTYYLSFARLAPVQVIVTRIMMRKMISMMTETNDKYGPLLVI